MAKLDVIGRSERIKVSGEKASRWVVARIDTGAALSSMDVSLAAKLRLGPIIDATRIRSSHGSSVRPVVRARVTIKNRTILGRFTVTDRSHMKYPLLVGRNILRKKFVIDPSRKVD